MLLAHLPAGVVARVRGEGEGEKGVKGRWKFRFDPDTSRQKAKQAITSHTTQHSTAQHSTAQHNTAQHSTAQHNTAQHSTAQHHSTSKRCVLLAEWEPGADVTNQCRGSLQDGWFQLEASLDGIGQRSHASSRRGEKKRQAPSWKSGGSGAAAAVLESQLLKMTPRTSLIGMIPSRTTGGW